MPQLESCSSTTPTPDTAAPKRPLRWLLLGLVICPVFGLAAWVVHRAVFRGTAYCAGQLERTLASSVHVHRLERPDPFRRVLRNVQFHDTDQTTFFASVPEIDWQCRPEGHLVALRGALINRQQVHRFCRLLHDRLTQQPHLLVPPWQVTAPKLRLVDATQGLLLHDVQATIQQHQDRMTARVRLATSDAADSAITIDIVRSRHDEEFVTEIDICATEAPLPCDLLRTGRMWETALTPDSMFHGTGWIDVTNNTWECDFVGSVEPFNLQAVRRMVCSDYPDIAGWQHTSESTRPTSPSQSIAMAARLDIVQAAFENGQLKKLDVIVSAPGGTIAGHDLAQLAQTLGVRIAPDIMRKADWREESYSFDGISCRLIAKPDSLLVKPTAAESDQDAANTTAVVFTGQPLLELSDPPKNGNPRAISSLFGPLPPMEDRAIP